MLLQHLEPIPKPPPTPPTRQLAVEKPSASAGHGIPVPQGKIHHIDQKPGREGIIMLAVPHGLAVHVPRQDMDVQMAHARDGVHAAQDLDLPVSSGG